jgi:MFS family permease
MTESLIRGWRWVKRNPDYRAYLWLRISFRFTDLGMTFFIPYGAQKLATAGSAAEMALLGGVMVATFKFSRVLSSALWGWMVDHRGDRSCLIGTGLSFTLAPLLALAAPLLPPVFGVPIPLTSATLDLPLATYLMALVVMGTAYQGSIIGGNRFLIGRAPPRRRLSYIGFLNTVTSPLTLMPLVAATVAAWFGVTVLFIGIVGGGLLYLYWALRVRPEGKPVSVTGLGAAAVSEAADEAA